MYKNFFKPSVPLSMRKTNVPKSFARMTGFTLIELMITVAIIAILAGIALPSYRDSVAKGHRAEARAVLLEASQWMERFFSENYRYDQNSAGTLVNAAMPANLRMSPKQGGAVYNIATVATATSYTLTATRATGGAMASDKCGDFTMTNTGVKSNVNHSGFANVQAAATACWK